MKALDRFHLTWQHRVAVSSNHAATQLTCAVSQAAHILNIYKNHSWNKHMNTGGNNWNQKIPQRIWDQCGPLRMFHPGVQCAQIRVFLLPTRQQRQSDGKAAGHDKGVTCRPSAAMIYDTAARMNVTPGGWFAAKSTTRNTNREAEEWLTNFIVLKAC